MTLKPGKKEILHAVSQKKMKRHRNIEQMTEQNKNSKHQVNKEEIRKTTRKKFRVMIVKMI